MIEVFSDFSIQDSKVMKIVISEEEIIYIHKTFIRSDRYPNKYLLLQVINSPFKHKPEFYSVHSLKRLHGVRISDAAYTILEKWETAS